MKKTLQRLLRAVSDHLPDISFEVHFWDGDTERFGKDPPEFAVTFATKGAAENIFRRGSERHMLPATSMSKVTFSSFSTSAWTRASRI